MHEKCHCRDHAAVQQPNGVRPLPPGIRYWFHLQNYELILALPITLLVVRRQEYLDVLYSLLVLGEMLLPLRLPAQEFRPWLEVLG